jgi:hypothetical protein
VVKADKRQPPKTNPNPKNSPKGQTTERATAAGGNNDRRVGRILLRGAKLEIAGAKGLRR